MSVNNDIWYLFFIGGNLEIKLGDQLRLLGYAGISVSYKRRLMAMGLVPGSQFEVKRFSLLGGACEIFFMGQSICLRTQEMMALQLETLS